MRAALFAGATALGLTHLAATTSAEACSWPGPDTSLIMPHESAHDVPTNTAVWIEVTSIDDLAEVSVGLRELGGAIVETVVEHAPSGSFNTDTLVLHPLAPLKPNTTYQLFDPARSGLRCGPARCVSDPYTVQGSFTTGPGPDEEAPVFAGAPVVAVDERVREENSCGKFDYQRFRISWPVAADGSALMYEIARADGGPALARTAGAGIAGWIACSDDSDANRTLGAVSGNGAYVVRAMDIAGNMTESAPVIVDVTCAAPPPPPTPEPQPQPEPLDPDDRDDHAACTIAAPGGASPSSAGLLVGGAALALVLARRRRRA